MGGLLLEIEKIRKWFPLPSGFFGGASGTVRAVEEVSLSIAPGETLGLVGESGCGKSTLGRLALRLIEPTSGSIRFEGDEITRYTPRELRAWRRKAQMIFQDPLASLNPRLRIRQIVGEALSVHRLARGAALRDRVVELLERVGLSTEALEKFPHQFSGGQSQRIGIARALAVEPKLIVADEAVSALDVSIQAQVLNLFLELQEEMRISYLFISHDLRVVEFVSHRIAVMYLGRLMEVLPANQLGQCAVHPYTRALLDANPDPFLRFKSKTSRARRPLSGDVPSPIDPPSGCVFHPRCPRAESQCRYELPTLREYAEGHLIACHLV